MNKVYTNMVTAVFVVVIIVAVAITLSLTQPDTGTQITTPLEIPQTDAEGIMVTNGMKHLVPLEKIIGGGPPKDGIPSIDRPRFVQANDAAFLHDDDLGLGLEYNGIKKFYPFRILVWHEIVNDNIGDFPVLITYCPLCQSGVAFSREIRGRPVEFGTSGKLYNSNLVMYDRLTDSYWYQITGQAIAGELTGLRLEKRPIETVKWEDWKAAHPDTLVLSTDTGFLRDYNTDPYGDYYTSEDVYFPLEHTDDRLHPKTFGYAIEINRAAKFYPRDELAKAGIVNDMLGGKDILVVQDPETGAIRIFDRNFTGNILAFEIQDGKLIDDFGSEWNFNGQGTEGILTQVIGEDLFWFSWAADHPDTELFIA